MFRKIGKDVIIWPLAKLVNLSKVSIANSVMIDDYTYIHGGENTEIGNFIHIASFVSITGGGELIMKDFSNISTGCKILTGTDDFSGRYLMGPTVDLKYRKPFRAKTILEKYTIVGANCVLFPGITLGEGCAIGANSIVNKNCLPWTIYVGSPAKPIKKRENALIMHADSVIKECFDENGNYIEKKLRPHDNNISIIY